MLLGDSFTSGLGVEDEERWANLVEARINNQVREKIDLINCAQPSTGPAQYAKALFQNCLDYEPDLVLICVYFNDVFETRPDEGSPADPPAPAHPYIHRTVYSLWPHIHALAQKALNRYQEYNRVAKYHDLNKWATEQVKRSIVPEDRAIKWRRCVPPNLIQAVTEEKMNPNMLLAPLLIPNFHSDVLNLGSEIIRKKFATMRSILSSMVQACRRENIEIIVAYLPSGTQYDPAFSRRYFSKLFRCLESPIPDDYLQIDSNLQIELRQWAAREKVSFWDITPDLRRGVAGHEAPLSYYIDGHWTTRGHCVAADAMTLRFMEFFTNRSVRAPSVASHTDRSP